MGHSAKIKVIEHPQTSELLISQSPATGPSLTHIKNSLHSNAISNQQLRIIMDKPLDRTIFQNAWVVPDIESACMKWVDELGIGPFFLTDYKPGTFESITYRGEQSDLSMKVAIAQAGNVQIELIEPLTEQCAYHDSVPKGQMGFHHMCVWTLDFEADLTYMESLGYTAANTGKVGHIDFAYFDTRPLMGCMLEVVTKNEGTVARFAEIAAAAENWDGKDPIR